MAITAKKAPRELIETGMHVARCIKMYEIGTVTEEMKGDKKTMYKVQLTWELPELLKTFDESKGPQPKVISKEFTLSLSEKANLRKAIDSWRGKPLSEEEAASFDITVLLGKPCLLNITHATSKTGNDYEVISAITPVMKGMTVPPQINPTVELSYDKWDDKLFESLPDFLKDKIKSTPEYKSMKQPAFVDENGKKVGNDLPWEDYETDAANADNDLAF